MNSRFPSMSIDNARKTGSGINCPYHMYIKEKAALCQKMRLRISNVGVAYPAYENSNFFDSFRTNHSTVLFYWVQKAVVHQFHHE